ncbi:uncharacterized protein LOC120843001 [Ixodes scapularis]|uniref:uncharacterized protein LOC120843001 n=1 Tax=Ixodes scapularis TaxID=6945 RepID=UPI001A9CEAB1|nr:uncharacterized protein LOC120843001 [Ixodes scapularis]
MKYVRERMLYVEHREIQLANLGSPDCPKSAFCYVPIESLLTNLLTTDASEHIFGSRDVVTSAGGALHDVTDGEFTKELIRNGDQDSILILLYTDELEIVNPLGSAAGTHKLLVVYFSIVNFHPKYRSQLSSMHVLAVVKYADVKTYGLQPILDPLLTDLSLLRESGFDVCHDGVNHHVTVTVVGVVRDNLSLHRIGGFSACFGKGKVCRFCLASSKELKRLPNERLCVIRTADTQKSHIEAVNLNPASAKLYGVKGESPLLTLPGFDVTSQLLPDAMHDVLEGGIAFVLKHVLKRPISSRILEPSCFDAISEFPFGYHDKKSKPPCTNKAEGKLKGTASQKLCLFRLLPQLLSKDIPEGNVHWEIYLKYREVVNIILANQIPEDVVAFLEVLIDTFFRKSVSRYPESNLIPKLHYLVHYHRFIRMFGPPRRFWSMRFESKHAYLKTIATRSRNFRNICKTVATRYQAKQCYEFSSLRLDEPLSTSGSQKLKWESLEEDVREMFPEIPSSGETMYSVVSATFDKCHYRKGAYCTGWEDELPAFSQVFVMIVFRGSLLIFVQKLHTLRFCRHRQSYKVVHMNKYCLLNPMEQFEYHALDLYPTVEGNEVIPYFELFENV